VTSFIKIMLARGHDIRDVAAILGISVRKTLKTLAAAKYETKPKRK